MKKAPVTVEERRRAAAEAAAKLVKDGDRVGLGTGRTASAFVEALAARAKRESLTLTTVATSIKTAELARERGLTVVDVDAVEALDIAVDGADEVDPQLDLVKGLGGALVRERYVERLAKRLVIVVDDEKVVPALGRGKVPVEIVPFGTRRTLADLAALGAMPVVRLGQDGKPFVTDNGNWIADLTLPKGTDARSLAPRIKALPGVVDHGLFLGMATDVLVGQPDGSVKTLRR